ncbi:LCP family protein [Haloactinomyces albus]|uniref:LCP family protein required for cell wall assembly n=1 Tax=Haloactinomyces albus TaxID=1352928 RepID=A0AAE3ZB33_9ACTN|nr:LCP family protein [Haloactinomyces albus]MDR7299849.1 LCP family protein required for cell wall assembly [Haloactinomyces albus]
MNDWSANQPPRGRRPRPNRPQGQPGQPGQAGYDYYHGADRPQQARTQPIRSQGGPPPPPQQPGTARPPSTGGTPPSPRPTTKPRNKRRWPRRAGIAVGLVVVLLAALVFYVDSVLQRTPALADYEGRIPDTPGTNWLLVGSDSRQGLDESRREELSAGDAGGRRTDTMMLVHIPAGQGQPSLISLPRDSSVPIAGHGRGKLNAAFAYGGPKLLVQTVETITGVHLDHYAEIGLGGFAELVNAVGGVEMCLDEPLRDPKAGIDLAAGCQHLDGAQALGFVRSRAFAEGDLQRVENQRKLLGALIGKVTSPATLFNPLRMFPLISGIGDTFLIDNNDHIWHLAWLAWTMNDISSGQGITTTVPIAGFGRLNGQSVVKWDSPQASAMFEAIANDRPIPARVVPN